MRSPRSNGSRRQTAGLEGGAAADLLLAVGLPDRLAHEQAGLHDLGETVRDLLARQRRERRGVDDHAARPVERADEVLPLRDVDRDLAADRRVDLRDEGRGYRSPGDAAEVGRGHEAGQIAGRAAAERDECAAAVEAQRGPESFRLGKCLRALAGRHLVGRDQPVTERSRARAP